MEDQEITEEEVDEIVSEGEWKEVHTTAGCDHEYAYAPSPPGNLTSVQCTKCWQGGSIDLSVTTLKDGKIVSTK